MASKSKMICLGMLRFSRAIIASIRYASAAASGAFLLSRLQPLQPAQGALCAPRPCTFLPQYPQRMQARVLGGAERMRAFVTRQAAQAREFAPEFILNFQLRAFVFFNVFSHWRRRMPRRCFNRRSHAQP